MSLSHLQLPSVPLGRSSLLGPPWKPRETAKQEASEQKASICGSANTRREENAPLKTFVRPVQRTGLSSFCFFNFNKRT